jgi:hypothetical protein
MDATNTSPFPPPQPPVSRNVSFLLGLGILFFPYIFSWFTLRAGYTTFSRVVSFAWLALALIILFASPSSNSNSASTNQAEPSTLVSSQEQPVQETQEAAPAPSAIQVSAQDLFRHYEANEVAADRNFKGQILEVSGSVKGIDSGMGDGANVEFNVGDEYGFNTVTATGDANFDNFAATLSKGQQLTLRCTGAGEVIGQPMLNDCQPI